MVVSFTGTRFGMTDRQQKALAMMLDSLPIRVFCHGGCRGADAQAHDMAVEQTGAKVHVWLGTDDSGTIVAARSTWEGAVVHPARPFLMRNRILVSMADLVIAAPKHAGEEERGGTWYTYKRARMERVPTLMLWP